MQENQRICYIHIGTHKTGSSAIQRLIMENREKLERHGILVPLLAFETDFMLGGHVNIPRELSGDILFNPKFGTVVDLFQTIRDASCSTAIVSSELFEFLWAKPEGVHRLASWIARARYTPKVIVYLRSRSRYIESLYSQMLRHGFDCPFDEYFGDILTHGRFESTDGFLKFQFEYTKIVAPFAEAFGPENIIAKKYGEKHGLEFLYDFLDTVGCPQEVREELDILAVENETLTFAEALDLLFQNARAYAGATGPSPDELVHDLYGNDTDFTSHSFSVTDYHDAANLSTRFARDRIELAQRYGLEVPLLEPIRDIVTRKKQRHVLREAAARWGLRDYRKRCGIRFRAGMIPLNLLEAAENLRAATECPS
jgi:hypothetical protein